MDKGATKRADLEKKLVAYSVTAGAALACVQQADANIIWSGPQNLPFTLGSPVQIDFDSGGINDVMFSIGNFNSSGPPMLFSDLAYVVPPAGNGFASTWSARKFSAGQLIGAGNTFSTGPNGYLAGQWLSSTMTYIPGYTTPTYGGYMPGTTFPIPLGNGSGGNFLGSRGYVGVQFQIGASTHYAWVDVEVNGSATAGTVHGWAHEDVAGGGIPAGAIPEPGSLALLAMGAAGLYAWRKGRKEDEVSEES